MHTYEDVYSECQFHTTTMMHLTLAALMYCPIMSHLPAQIHYYYFRAGMAGRGWLFICCEAAESCSRVAMEERKGF